MHACRLGLLAWLLFLACAAASPAGTRPRHLLGAGAAAGSNSSRAPAQPDPSFASLSWLHPPPEGWTVWQPRVQPAHQPSPCKSGSGLGSTAALPSPEQRRAAARLVVQQIMAHLEDGGDEVLPIRSRSLGELTELGGSSEAEDASTALEAVAAAAAQRLKAVAPAPAAAVEAAAGPAAAPLPSTAQQPAQPPVEAGTFTTTAAAAAPGSKPGLVPQVVARGRVRFPAPFHSAYPPSGVPWIPQPRALGCPLASSVLVFGASADGQADCSRALAAADNSTLQMLYFPRGTYRLSRSLTLRRPVVMGMGTRFLLDANVRLALAAQPMRAPKWHDPMFTGPGAGLVRMGPRVREVYPAWWSDPLHTDSGALQFAVNSCSSGASCTVLLSRPLDLPKPVTWNPTTGVFATARGVLRSARGGAGEGVILPAGNYTRPLVFSSIRGFKQFGLKLLPGVRNANLQIGQLSMNGDGAVFEASPTAPIVNTTISHVSVFQSNQNSIVFDSPQPRGRLDGVTVRGNFMLKGGATAPEQPSAGVLFRGAPPQLTKTQVVLQAIDPAQFLTPTRFVAVATNTSCPVAGFAFRSDTWNGGYEAPGGAQVDGSFVDSHFLFSFPDQVGGRIFAFRTGSAGNVLSKGDTGEVAAASHFFTLVPAPGNLSAFSAANPVGPLSPVPMPVAHQGFYVIAPVTKAWPPGEKRTLYLHSHFAQPGVQAKRLECGIPFKLDNPGLLCLAIAAAPTAREPHRVALSLANLGTKAVPAGFDLRFAVQLGPG